MFGTLRPVLCSAPSDDRKAYRRAYCGTCKALGDGYGQVSRALLSYDLVFLAQIIESTQVEAGSKETCRCPMLPVLQKDIVAPSRVSVRVAAALQIVLADAWLDDQVADGGALYKPARGMIRKKTERAYTELAGFGIDLGFVREIGSSQSALEAQTKDLESLAAPTGAMLAGVLESLPRLPGAVQMTENDEQSLATLASSLGIAIYTIDAFEDLEADLRQGAFNPFSSHGRLDREALLRGTAILEAAILRVRGAIDALPVARAAGALEASLRGLERRAKRAVGSCYDQLAELAAQQKVSAARRCFLSFWTTLTWLPLWLVARGRRAWRMARKAPQAAHTCPSTALAYEGLSSGSGNGAGVGQGQQVARRKRQKKKKGEKGDCCDCCDCCECCFCLSVFDNCGDGEGDCCDGCDCCSCDSCGCDSCDCCSCDC